MREGRALVRIVDRCAIRSIGGPAMFERFVAEPAARLEHDPKLADLVCVWLESEAERADHDASIAESDVDEYPLPGYSMRLNGQMQCTERRGGDPPAG